MSEYQLPTLQELHSAPEIAFKNDQFNKLLSSPPSDKWVKKHPIVNVKDSKGNDVPLKYIPVDKVRHLMTVIFQDYDEEVRNVQVAFNAIVVTVRVLYTHPVTKRKCFKDGTGAVEIQTKKGAPASDLSQITNMAVMKATPAAESYAFKRACEKIGRIFGGDLNRWDLATFEGKYTPAKDEDIETGDEKDLEVNTPETKVVDDSFATVGANGTDFIL